MSPSALHQILADRCVSQGPDKWEALTYYRLPYAIEIGLRGGAVIPAAIVSQQHRGQYHTYWLAENQEQTELVAFDPGDVVFVRETTEAITWP